MVYQGREAKEQIVFSYMRTLAKSHGLYGRLLDAIEYAKEFYPEDYEELSHHIQLAEIITDGFEIVENALSKKDLPLSDIYCHVCGSDNISIQKGNGELIIGDDRIALVCHDCEKIYKFNDVKYRSTT